MKLGKMQPTHRIRRNSKLGSGDAIITNTEGSTERHTYSRDMVLGGQSVHRYVHQILFRAEAHSSPRLRPGTVGPRLEVPRLIPDPSL